MTESFIASELKRQLKGEVFSSDDVLSRFSKDESIFEERPTLVVAPKDEEDLSAIVGVATRYGIPVTARGGGTSVAGQAVGKGIIVDFTRHMNRILDISADRAVVQPGVVLDDLNGRLAESGRWFAPDPSSRASCTLGGMVATNASGPRSFRFGSVRDHVMDLKCIGSDGGTFHSRDGIGRLEVLVELLNQRKVHIDSSGPKTRKNSSGYFLSGLVGSRPDLTGLLVGSEGTLALVSQIEVKTLPLPVNIITTVFNFDSWGEAFSAVEALRDLRPLSIELIDSHIVDVIERLDPELAQRMGYSNAKASLWVEWEGESAPKALPARAHWLRTSDEQKRLWRLRSLASKELQKLGGPRKPLRFVEDAVVPPENLKEYGVGLRKLIRANDCDGPIFGHAGDGHLHVNPRIDVTKPDLVGRMERVMDDAYHLVGKFGGSISGEHGDGLLRAYHSRLQWAPVWDIFVRIKETLDPKGILNPGKKLGPGKRPLESILARRIQPSC